MNPERLAALVARWVKLYTAGLPASAAGRRIEEIDADLHDHIAHERQHGTSNRRIALAIASRVIRGAVADLTWRSRETRSARKRSIKEPTVKTSSLRRSALRVTAGVLVVLAIPFIGTALSEDLTWSVADFALAGVLLAITGISFELAARRSGTVLIGGALASLGVLSAVIGEVDDAPGLVLLGALLIVGGGAITYRKVQRAQ